MSDDVKGEPVCPIGINREPPYTTAHVEQLSTTKEATMQKITPFLWFDRQAALVRNDVAGMW